MAAQMMIQLKGWFDCFVGYASSHICVTVYHPELVASLFNAEIAAIALMVCEDVPHIDVP